MTRPDPFDRPMQNTLTMTNVKKLPFLLLFALWSPSVTVSLSRPESPCKAWLVQSIPTDMPLLPPSLTSSPLVRLNLILKDSFLFAKQLSEHGLMFSEGNVVLIRGAGEVLKWMARNATKRMDIIAQYWQFVPGNKNPESGDFGYSDEDMVRFGADEGRNVFMALEDAADRNVNLRILQHSGVYPDYANESAKLAAGRPNVENITLISANWWGSGIVHTKAWISDNKDVYIGSANSDWKSLTQVKEHGIYLANCPAIAKKVKVYFNNLWKLSSLNPVEHTKLVWDEQWQVKRRVPCWSHSVNKKERCESPLPKFMNVPHVNGYPIKSDPYLLSVPLETPGSNTNTSTSYSSYLSFAPPELLFDKYQSDEQAWIETIKSVQYKEIVRINTMDWLGQSQYADQTIYWSSLSTAISEVVFSRSATV